MIGYEYKVIPAPAKGVKAPGIKGPEARFANAREQRMNAMAAEGWEYQRADILPSEERQGLTSTHTVYRSVLVFRRPLAEAAVDTPDALTPAPEQQDDAPAEPGPEAGTDAPEPDAPEDAKDDNQDNKTTP